MAESDAGRPFMPVEIIANQLREGCADYADGDDPGHFTVNWNPDSRELALGYTPDENPEAGASYRPTTHVFRLGAQARAGSPSLGQTAYSGYFTACGGRSLISGAALPSWVEQSDEIRAAWDAAADAVRRAL